MDDPVGMALKKDRRGFLDYFAQQSDERLLAYKTKNGDSAIHIAAAMDDHELIQEFLERLAPRTRLEALKEKDAFGNTGLHEAATVKDFEVARVLVEFSRKSTADADEYKKLLEVRNGLGETPIYRAAALGKTKVLEILTEQVGDLYRHFHRNDDKTILHIAVLGQHFETAIWLLDHDRRLAYERTKEKNIGFTCLELLALMPTAFKSEDIMKKWPSLFDCHTWIDCLTSVLFACLRTYLDDDCNYKEDLETDKIDNRIGHTKKRGGIFIRKKCICFWGDVIKGCPRMKKIWEEKKMHENAVALVKMLVKIEIDRDRNPPSIPPWAERWKQEISTSSTSPTSPTTVSLGFGKGHDIMEKNIADFSAEELIEVLKIKDGTDKAVDDHQNATTKSKTLLFAASNIKTLLFAASNGITQILEVILEQNPQAILSDDVNGKGQTILHVAIRRRQHNVFRFITKKMQLYVPKWAARIDNRGYTILHHAADMKHYKKGISPGPVYQFQEELQWFERAKEIAPNHYEMHRDGRKRMTAIDLFDQTHKDQLRKAQKWITQTSESCSTLAILIVTVVFAAAYTVPGGTNEVGFPNFLGVPLFNVFAVTDVASLSFSLSSVVVFLSILTWTRESPDFRSDLPSKLKWGLSLLFCSVLSSMITFSASLLLIIRLGKNWTAALYAAAIFPVIVLALMMLRHVNCAANLKHYLNP